MVRLAAIALVLLAVAAASAASAAPTRLAYGDFWTFTGVSRTDTIPPTDACSK